jgi:hypothetical protein
MYTLEQFQSLCNPAPETFGIPAYFVGLDLGQAQDFTALAILERHGSDAETFVYHCRHLQRWPLKTSYPSIVVDVAKIMNSDKMQAGKDQPKLAIDATGVGAPVVDMFRRERMSARLRPIQITGGADVTGDGLVTRVPKRDLVSAAQVALQAGKLRIAPALPEAPALLQELQNFKVKISLDTAHDSYGAWREGTHDDLVLAVALALWLGSKERQWRML